MEWSLRIDHSNGNEANEEVLKEFDKTDSSTKTGSSRIDWLLYQIEYAKHGRMEEMK